MAAAAKVPTTYLNYASNALDARRISSIAIDAGVQ